MVCGSRAGTALAGSLPRSTRRRTPVRGWDMAIVRAGRPAAGAWPSGAVQVARWPPRRARPGGGRAGNRRVWSGWPANGRYAVRGPLPGCLARW